MISRRFDINVDDKIFLGITLAMIIAGVLVSTSILRLMSTMLIIGIFGFSYNLLHGYTGLVSFGHATFLGFGAYIGIVTLLNFSENLGICFLLVVIATGALATLIGGVCSRTRGAYFSMATLAFSMLLYYSVYHIDLFGRSNGLSLPWSPFFFVDISNAINFFYLAVVVFVIAYLIIRKIVNSHFGTILTAIRDNETKVRALGYNVYTLKWRAFIISGILAGIAGYLFMLNNFFVGPSTMSILISAQVVLITLIGGVGYRIGPMLGSILWFTVHRLIGPYPGFSMVALGIVFIAVLWFFPKGIMSYITKKIT